MEHWLVLTHSTGWTSWHETSPKGRQAGCQLRPRKASCIHSKGRRDLWQPVLQGMATHCHFCSVCYREQCKPVQRRLFLLILLGIVPGPRDERVMLGNALSDNGMKKHSDWRLFPDAMVTGHHTDTGTVSKQKIKVLPFFRKIMSEEESLVYSSCAKGFTSYLSPHFSQLYATWKPLLNSARMVDYNVHVLW